MRKRVTSLVGTVLVAVMLLTTPLTAQAAWANPFRDVQSGDWFYNAVEYVNTEGLFSGTSEDTFSPESAMTRGMFVTVLGKFAKIDAAVYSKGQFTDVSDTAYYAPYVGWASETGLVSGVGNGCFAPNSSITREQMATIFYKYAKLVGADTTVTPDKLRSFPDGLNTSEYAQQAMAWAVTHGVLGGSDGNLLPQGTATRAQTAQIIYNARNLLTTQVETPPEGAKWVVDQLGHYVVTKKYEQVLIPGTEVGHWEDEWYSVWVYKCNQCGLVTDTEEEMWEHEDESIENYHKYGTSPCFSYTRTGSDPIYTGKKYWVVDKEGEYEWQWTTDYVWIDEEGHWE